ncbi:MAG: acyl-CoA dehydrogenase family protein [Pseudoclavibacter sp.]
MKTATSTGTMAPDIPSLIARIAELRPLLEKNAAEGEKQSRVVEESIQALADAGAFRVTQPKRYGGYQGNLKAQVDVAREVGKGDGGTGWVVALTNISNWLTSLLPEAAQEEVWGTDPNNRVSVVLATTGTARKVEGGYRLTGRWGYNSAGYHTQWTFVGAELVDENGEPLEGAQVLVDRSECETEETWFVAGLRASGSNTIIANDVFVPDHRVLPSGPAMTGQYPGTTEDTDPVYRSGWIPVLNLILVGPQLGIGQAVLEKVIEQAKVKGIAYTNIERQSDSVAVQLDIARAALLLDTADLFAQRAANLVDDHAQRGVYPEYLLRAQNRADAGWIVQHVKEAIDVLLTVAGSGVFAEKNPLQRMWRDQEAASRHAFILPNLGYELYGKALLGRTDGDTVTLVV